VGLSTKQVQRHVRRLEELKLVQRKARFQSGGARTTNEYDLSGLASRLRVIEREFATAKKVKTAARKAGGLAANLPAGLTGKA
jgi:predicted ArsR family transcriptional regulator